MGFFVIEESPPAGGVLGVKVGFGQVIVRLRPFKFARI